MFVAVGGLKVEVIRSAPSNKPHSSRQRGGALGARMNLFDRFARVVKVVPSVIYPYVSPHNGIKTFLSIIMAAKWYSLSFSWS